MSRVIIREWDLSESEVEEIVKKYLEERTCYKIEVQAGCDNIDSPFVSVIEFEEK